MGDVKQGEPESGLVERLRQGDSDAFDELFEKYRRRLLAYVYGLLGDRGLAEDVVQDTFLRLARRAVRIDPRRGAGAWLYRVARNRAIDVLRKRRFETPVEVLPVRALPTGEEGRPDVSMQRAETAAAVRGALDSLPAREKDVLLLRYYGDLQFKQIARVLRRPLGTVLWQARRAMERMERRLLSDRS